MQAQVRQSASDLDYQPSRVHSTFTATAIDPDTTVWGEEEAMIETAVAYRVVETATVPTIVDSGCNRTLVHHTMPMSRVKTGKTVHLAGITEHTMENPVFDDSRAIANFSVRPTRALRSIGALELHRMLGHAGVREFCDRNGIILKTTPRDEPGLTLSQKEIIGQASGRTRHSTCTKHSTTTTTHLERIARAEDTPVVLRNRNRPPSRSSVRRIRFVDSKHVPPPKPKAPRDIDGNVDERNIVTGSKRDRKQTPANTSTHTYRLAVAEDCETQFVSQTDTNDGLRYEDVCLFTRVLRKPEKQLRIIPQVVEARQKEIQGLYDAKCLEWATWQDAERDRVKPIRTGFVDAIKEDEATGYLQSTVDACVFFLKGEDSIFPSSIAYDERSLPWILLLRTDDMLAFCLKEKQHEELVKKLGEAKFRFTDKGEVEDRGFENAKPSTTPCTEQEPQSADPDASIRQWPLRKLAGCAYTCTESRTNVVTGRRNRKQTAPNTPTHTYKLAVAENDEEQFAAQENEIDGVRYSDVCLFTRVLRKPETQLRLIPQVVEARKKEVQGLYDAKCLQWATWQDAERDQEKPNMIWRVMKALYDSPQAGRRWYNHIASFLRSLGYLQSTVDACVFYLKGEGNSFPPKLTYDTNSLPWIVLLRTDDMLAFCMKEQQYALLIGRLKEAQFRFTDKGDVSVFCGVQIADSAMPNRP
eukprot:g66686.t1